MRYFTILLLCLIVIGCDKAAQLNGEIDDAIAAEKFLEASEIILRKESEGVETAKILRTAQYFSEKTAFDYSVPLLEKLLEIDSQNVAGRLILANNYRQQKKYNEALKIYDDLADIDSVRFIVLPERARLYIHISEFNKATADIAEAKGLQPKYFASYLADGLLQFSQGRMQEALDLFEVAESLDPGVSAEASLYAGYVLLKGKLNYDALSKFTRAIENGKNINKGFAFINRGVCQINLTDTTFACNDWDSAYHYMPEEAERYRSQYCR